MSMYHVERDPVWQNAPKNCRSEFIEAMRNKQYGASETREAWEWFSLGWAAKTLDKKPQNA